MGLKDELDADLQEAFDEDLADAVRTMVYKVRSTNYDESTGASNDTFTAYDTRGVRLHLTTEEKKDLIMVYSY